MRRLAALVLAAVTALSGCASPPEPNTPGEPAPPLAPGAITDTVQASVPVRTDPPWIKAIAFATSQHGWIIFGDAPAIETRDGGASSLTRSGLSSLCISGSDGKIVSHDGGRTWAYRNAVPPPPASPTDPQQAAPVEDSPLATYRSDLLGVSFSYPEGPSEPVTTETGIPTLKLDLMNGELSISRRGANPDTSLAELMRQHIDENTRASHGRMVSTDLGQRTLGGVDAWGVQQYFASAAGRVDSLMYIVLTGGFEYRVACSTKQGPPVTPWEAVAPVCEGILETVEFSGS